MWYGEYHHTLDNKDRFILPAKFREKIKKTKTKKFYLTRGLDGCLFLFPQQIWKKLEEKLNSLDFTKYEVRFFNRLYFSGAQEIEIDTQGRINLPSHLKEYAQIKKEIVIIGVAERIEIWAEERWEEFYAHNRRRFEEIAQKLF
ncbi:MAG: cell division/cell wall cluster transcriptional repressor MraZ [Candidatus Omnitrophota bacterium]|nr:MAG: cell division/cell wall cluster transcriptional repressor MraZ [Candidatus Omnitrophota bacterium]